MSTIVDIDCRLFRVPLPEVMSDAMHGDHTHFELVTATVKCDDGLEGSGYSDQYSACCYTNRVQPGSTDG